MPRLITLSRAARLVGVKRGALQKRIQQGELRTFEGELLLADLLRVYPQTRVEDTTMLERVEHIMEQAVNKIVRTDADEAPDTSTLAARILALGQELAQARQNARRYRTLVEQLQQKFRELETADDAAQAYNSIRDWFQQAVAAAQPPDATSEIIAKEAFLRVMAAQVRILPSGHEFFIEGSDSILEAGLRSGLALDYGCSNGNCGHCKAKVVSGQVKKIAAHDYALSDTEKGLGYILTCCNTAVTDVVLEAEEALGSRDIPRQEIDIRLRKIEQPDDRVMILHARTPRTQRLRFLAGQHLTLAINDQPGQQCSIASCPCDDMNLEFHVPLVAGSHFSEQLRDSLKTGASIHVCGPQGNFTLDEDSPHSLVFIAGNAGFGPVKSLVEHAMALDAAEQIHLYWITTPGNSHYLGNLCRAWSDALDNFHYTALEATDEHPVAALLPEITAGLEDLPNLDFYACVPEPLLETVESHILGQGVPPGQLRLEPLRQEPAD